MGRRATMKIRCSVLAQKPRQAGIARPWRPLWRPVGTYSGGLWSTVKYLLRTEVHTFAFSVAANALLSFFPFVVLLMTLIRRVFHSPTMYDVVVEMLRDYLPAGQDFVIRNLNAMVGAKHRAQVVSLLILLVTSTGIFLPLEVALNRIWGFTKNRSYFGNQLVSLLLAFGCGVLALLSIAASAGNIHLLSSILGSQTNFIVRLVGFLVMKLLALVTSIMIFFLIYWVLPNGRVPRRGLADGGDHWASVGSVEVWVYPRAAVVNFQEVYGPFALSVTLMFWAFLSGLLLLTGAHLSANGYKAGRSFSSAPSAF